MHPTGCRGSDSEPQARIPTDVRFVGRAPDKQLLLDEELRTMDELTYYTDGTPVTMTWAGGSRPRTR